jgi:hypothetical protein
MSSTRGSNPAEVWGGCFRVNRRTSRSMSRVKCCSSNRRIGERDGIAKIRPSSCATRFLTLRRGALIRIKRLRNSPSRKIATHPQNGVKNDSRTTFTIISPARVRRTQRQNPEAIAVLSPVAFDLISKETERASNSVLDQLIDVNDRKSCADSVLVSRESARRHPLFSGVAACPGQVIKVTLFVCFVIPMTSR